MTQSRFVPTVPEPDRSLRLLIDTDAANEIDDLYAIALALVSPDRFRVEGFVATHFATWNLFFERMKHHQRPDP